jgi:glyceraldehyde-3-phosphate dehydrogenase (NADP+)
MISFTGGTNTGLRIASMVKMIPLVMELGGKDPAIVRDDADLPFTAKQIVTGAFSYSAQRCTAVKRVIVHASVADQLVALLKPEIEQLTVGSPVDNCTVVPLIDEGSANYVQELIDDAIEKGATLVTGNKREFNLIHPTLLDNVTENMRICWEEPFGPVLPIIRVKCDEEAIDMANRSEFGLQSAVFTKNIDRAFSIANRLESGSVQINSKTERGPDHFPFIGIKSSGMGVQGVRKSLESMTRDRVIILNINE